MPRREVQRDITHLVGHIRSRTRGEEQVHDVEARVLGHPLARRLANRERQRHGLRYQSIFVERGDERGPHALRIAPEPTV